jgi:uncharacterized membrane protein YdbT with pleckstrin-like domain
MPYPQDALAPHEELVLNLHPHWWYMAGSTALLVAAIVIGSLEPAGVVPSGPDWLHAGWFLAAAIIVALGWFLIRFGRWITTNFVLTSDRVMSRSGLLSKSGIEIPLERINTVFFHQHLFERLIGLGDLEIESASTDGAERFDDVRRPSDIQKEIYIQMERNKNRDVDRIAHATDHSAAERAAAAPAPAASSSSGIADQIEQLAKLRDQGHLTEAEFQAKKAELLGRM